MNALNYKGYLARVEFDAEDEIFTGRVAGVNDVVGFHADSVEALKQAFHEAVDGYLATCKEIGKPPDRPFSGKVMFRISPDVHARATLAAELAGVSLNQWAESVMKKASG